HDEVIVPNHLPRSLQCSPDACMFEGSDLSVRKNGESADNRLHVALSPRSVRKRSSLHAMPQPRNSYSSDFQFLVLLRSKPAPEVEVPFLPFDDDIGIEHYRHRSLGRRKALRAASRSLRNARASSLDKSISASASANSGPVHPLLPSGTMRATGKPFRRRTKVTF